MIRKSATVELFQGLIVSYSEDPVNPDYAVGFV
jgi:hypothetical protein